MKKALLCLWIAVPLFAQVDLFTGQLRPAAPPEEEIPPLAKAESIPLVPLEEALPAEPSVMLILGKDGLPPFAQSPNVRGFAATIDWSQIPDLGYNKEEIKTISILKREISAEQGDLKIFSPYLWHFKADQWETVYRGFIPYLEELLFLEDSLRVRLTTKIEAAHSQSGEGYLKDNLSGAFGFYQAVNTPSPQTVSQIMVVSPEDNREIQRMILAFQKASPVPPIQKMPAPLGTEPQEINRTNSAYNERPPYSTLEGGVSLFEEILP